MAAFRTVWTALVGIYEETLVLVAGNVVALFLNLPIGFMMSIDLLAMQQPMAIDLRFILAVTKINADLERVGDQAVNIAERVMDMVDLPKADLPVDIPRMAAAVSANARQHRARWSHPGGRRPGHSALRGVHPEFAQPLAIGGAVLVA